MVTDKPARTHIWKPQLATKPRNRLVKPLPASYINPPKTAVIGISRHSADTPYTSDINSALSCAEPLSWRQIGGQAGGGARRPGLPELDGAESEISSMEERRLDDWMKRRQAMQISTPDAMSEDLKHSAEPSVSLLPAKQSAYRSSRLSHLGTEKAKLNRISNLTSRRLK